MQYLAGRFEEVNVSQKAVCEREVSPDGLRYSPVITASLPSFVIHIKVLQIVIEIH